MQKQDIKVGIAGWSYADWKGVVYPAADLPFMAKENGVAIIEVNPEHTPITSLADVVLQGPSGSHDFSRAVEAKR